MTVSMPNPPQWGPALRPCRWQAGLMTALGGGALAWTATLASGSGTAVPMPTAATLPEVTLLLEGPGLAPPPPPPPPPQGSGTGGAGAIQPVPEPTGEETTDTSATDPLAEAVSTETGAGEASELTYGGSFGEPDGVPGGVAGGVPGGVLGGVPGGEMGGSPGGVPGGKASGGGTVPPGFSAAYLRNPQPKYPPVSRRLGEEGKVVLRVRVSAEGAPQTVEFKSSSGFPRLDQAALEAVRCWRFVPAHQAGQPISAWVLVPIQFALR